MKIDYNAKNVEEKVLERVSLLDEEYEYWLKKGRESKDSQEIFDCRQERATTVERLKFIDCAQRERQLGILEEAGRRRFSKYQKRLTKK